MEISTLFNFFFLELLFLKKMIDVIDFLLLINDLALSAFISPFPSSDDSRVMRLT